MSLHPPSRYSDPARQGMGENALNLLEHELAGEKASGLGRAGQRVEEALKRLRDEASDSSVRPQLVKDAASVVYAYFIQRELCGIRRHQDAIRDYAIPAEVLVRLGSS